MTKHVTDELSAYLDGECAHPERVRSHLDTCASCAERLEELETLSARLRRLEAPEVGGAFATRIAAAVREEAPVHGMRPWRFVVAGMAAVALLVIVGAWRLDGVPQDSQDPRGTLAGVPTEEPSETTILAELERRFEDDTEQVDEMTWIWTETVEDTSDSGVWLDALASADWIDPMMTVLDAETDLDVMLESMSEDEITTLKELLVQELEKGQALTNEAGLLENGTNDWMLHREWHA